MKTKTFFGSILFFSLFMFVTPSLAGIFDSDERRWEELFKQLKLLKTEELKRINLRLEQETRLIQSMQMNQQSLLRKMEEIKNFLPELQGGIQQNKTDMQISISQTNKRLADLEAHFKLDADNQKKLQKKASEELRKELSVLFDGLKNTLASDMEKFASDNKQNFMDFEKGNKEVLAQVGDQLTAQNKSLEETKAIFKDELIPAIGAQLEQTRTAFGADIAKFQESVQAQLTANQKAMLDGFAKTNAGFVKVDAKTQKMAEFINNGIKESQAIKAQIGVLAQGLDKRLEGVAQGQETLRAQIDGSIKRLELVNQNLLDANKSFNENFKKINENQKTIHAQNVASGNSMGALKGDLANLQAIHKLTEEKFSKLIDSNQKLAVHSAQLDKKMDQSFQSLSQLVQKVGVEQAQVAQKLEQSIKKADQGQAASNAANKKLTRLIDILKTIASQQAKMDQLMQAQAEFKGSQIEILKAIATQQENMTQVFQVQTELRRMQGEVLKALTTQHGNLEQVYKSTADLKASQVEILKTIAGQQKKLERVFQTNTALTNSQAEIQKALADLRRKANVSISRSDDIKKTLSGLTGKKPTPATKRK